MTQSPKTSSSDLEDKMLSLKNDQSSVEEQWTVFRDTVHKTALEHLGPTTRRNQDWFDENDEEMQLLLAEKRRLLRAHQDDPVSTVNFQTKCLCQRAQYSAEEA